nr:hypothetical protein Iba_chr02bCG13550 [Ipomoea batatas]
MLLEFCLGNGRCEVVSDRDTNCRSLAVPQYKLPKRVQAQTLYIVTGRTHLAQLSGPLNWRVGQIDKISKESGRGVEDNDSENRRAGTCSLGCLALLNLHSRPLAFP